MGAAQQAILPVCDSGGEYSEFAEPQRAARKAARTAQSNTENMLISENRFENPVDDTSILDAPDQPRVDMPVPQALIESLASLRSTACVSRRPKRRA